MLQDAGRRYSRMLRDHAGSPPPPAMLPPTPMPMAMVAHVRPLVHLVLPALLMQPQSPRSSSSTRQP